MIVNVSDAYRLRFSEGSILDHIGHLIHDARDGTAIRIGLPKMILEKTHAQDFANGVVFHTPSDSRAIPFCS